MDDLLFSIDDHNQKKKLVLQVLHEEQIYEDCSDNFYREITKKHQSRAQIEAQKENERQADTTRSRKSTATGSKRSRRQRRYQRRQRLKVTYNGLNFGLVNLGLKLGTILVFLIGIQLVYYTVWRPGVRRSINFMEIFLLGIETWNSYFNMHSSWLSTIVYNNTLPYWNGKTSMQVYEHFKTHIRDNLLANYSRAVEYDLGNYTEKFVEAYTQVRDKEIMKIFYKCFSSQFFEFYKIFEFFVIFEGKRL